MIEIAARSINARRRGALAGLTGYGSRMSRDARVGEHFRLADLRAADARSAALNLPLATTGDLCVLACGRRRMPARIRERLHAVDVVQRAR